jgi:hypothetical protein
MYVLLLGLDMFDCLVLWETKLVIKVVWGII